MKHPRNGYPRWQAALAGLVRLHGLENSELGDISKRAGDGLEEERRYFDTCERCLEEMPFVDREPQLCRKCREAQISVSQDRS